MANILSLIGFFIMVTVIPCAAVGWVDPDHFHFHTAFASILISWAIGILILKTLENMDG